MDLEALVAVVAIPGELAATVTASHEDAWPLLYPESLHADLWGLACTLRDTLDNVAVTFLRHPRGHPEAHPGRCDNRAQSLAGAGEHAPRELGPAVLGRSGNLQHLGGRGHCQGHQRGPCQGHRHRPGRGPAGQDPPWPGDSWGQPGGRNPAAVSVPALGGGRTRRPEAREGTVVATGQVEVATSRGQRVMEARELLRRFLVACDKGTRFPWDLEDWLEGSEEWTEEVVLR
ncbi:uncharacterized protein [Chamaea fasciata]|uniref:uncharacterized protein isoform X3 n=1 Tax=Chamaea fasciata TaxID=190680 RepID=UPI00336A571A